MGNSKDSRPASEPSRAVDEALTKTRQVAEDIKDAADELAVVHAVLETGLPDNSTDPDVKEAVDRTRDLEKQLQESAQTLDSANEILQQNQAPRS
jgi:flagellar biosynthesis/type III secretory pathway ATPase